MNELDKSDITKARLLKCLEKSLGVVTTACRKAKVARSTYYLYLEEDKAFAAAVADIQEQALDFSESQLFKVIRGYTLPETKIFLDKDALFRSAETGEVIDDRRIIRVEMKKHVGPDTTAILFHLRTKGKKRGYVEKTEVEHSGTIKSPEQMSYDELKQSIQKLRKEVEASQGDGAAPSA